MTSLFDVEVLPPRLWPVIPGLGEAAVLRAQRIMRMWPRAKEVYISPTPVDRVKKDLVCWDAGPEVLLWLVLPDGIEVPDPVLERLRAALAADPVASGRPVVFGPALGEAQVGWNSSQLKLVRVRTWRPGVEWVSAHDSRDQVAIKEARAATRAAQQLRMDSFRRLDRRPAEPSYLDSSP